MLFIFDLFKEENVRKLGDLCQSVRSCSVSGPVLHLLGGMHNNILGSSDCVPVFFQAFWIMED